MKITPLDIQQQRFRIVFRGLDRGEVDAFLNLVASEVEAQSRRIHELEEDSRRQRRHIEDFREREQTLKDTMVTAQKITQDIQVSAQKEAEIVLANAELEAERIVSAAHSRLTELLEDIHELKRQRTVFLERLRGLLNTHEKLLEMEKDDPQEARRIEQNLSVFRRPEPAAALDDVDVQDPELTVHSS